MKRDAVGSHKDQLARSSAELRSPPLLVLVLAQCCNIFTGGRRSSPSKLKRPVMVLLEAGHVNNLLRANADYLPSLWQHIAHVTQMMVQQRSKWRETCSTVPFLQTGVHNQKHSPGGKANGDMPGIVASLAVPL